MVFVNKDGFISSFHICMSLLHFLVWLHCMLNSSENGHHYLVLREGKQTSDVSHRFFVNAFNGLRKFILFLADLVFLLVNG